MLQAHESIEALLKRIDEKDRLVDSYALSQLLQPEHPFFFCQQGRVDQLAYYRHDESSESYFVYPRVKAQGRLNPYRLKQLSGKNTARVLNQLDTLVEAQHLDGLKVVKIEYGFAKEISVYLSKQKHGANSAWSVERRFREQDIATLGKEIGVNPSKQNHRANSDWSVERRLREQDIATLGKEVGAQACRANLHTWSTTNPFHPHYHFHTLVLNYRLAEVDGVVDEDGEPANQLVRASWHKQRGGTSVPYTDEQTEELKQRWKQRQLNFAHWHNIAVPSLEGDGQADVRVRFLDLATDEGRARFLHDVTYFGRRPIEDYAKFTIDNPGCANPPEVLTHYANRTRVFGWWRDIKRFIAGYEPKNKRGKLSPLTGKPMLYVGAGTLDGLLELSGGDLGYIDFVKGKPVFGDFTPDEIERLKQLQHYPSDRAPPGEEQE